MNTTQREGPGPFAEFRRKEGAGSTWTPVFALEGREWSIGELLERTRAFVVTLTAAQVRGPFALTVLVSLNWQNAVQLLGAADGAEAVLRFPLMSASALSHCWHEQAPPEFCRAVLLLAALDLSEAQAAAWNPSSPIPLNPDTGMLLAIGQ